MYVDLFRYRTTSAVSFSTVCDHLILWCLNDNRRLYLNRSLRCNTLGIPVRGMVHARQRPNQYHVHVDFHGNLLEYSVSRSSSETRYTNKILFLFSVPFTGVSAHYVLADKHIDYSDIVVHQYLSPEANAEAYHKD